MSLRLELITFRNSILVYANGRPAISVVVSAGSAIRRAAACCTGDVNSAARGRLSPRRVGRRPARPLHSSRQRLSAYSMGGVRGTMRAFILALAAVSASISGCAYRDDCPSRASQYGLPVVVSPSVPLTIPVDK